MRRLLCFLVILWASVLSSEARARPVVSVGGLVSTPEVFGGYVSLWPSADVSLDLRGTLVTLDGGITGHLPLSAGPTHRHDLLLTALGGWVHSPSWYYDAADMAHVSGMVGYGYQSRVELRIMGGVTAYGARGVHWQTGPTFLFSVGWVFR